MILSPGRTKEKKNQESLSPSKNKKDFAKNLQVQAILNTFKNHKLKLEYQ